MTVAEHSSVQRIRSEEHSTLEALASELIRQQETKIDYVVDTRRMTFLTRGENEEGTEPVGSRLVFDGDGHDDVGGGLLTEHAHRQIRERLGIPARYYDRMRSDAPGLLDSNVQHWLHHPDRAGSRSGQGEKRMVRMLDGRVRAFLSNRYRRLDNLDLMEKAVLPELSQYDGRLVFHVSALTDERLYVRALLPDLAADIDLRPGEHTLVDGGGGDVVQAGVEIRNSEVGSGALHVAPFIWRLRCLNGLVIAQSGLSRYHLGREQDEAVYAILRDDTIEADDRAFWMKVRDAVGAALSETTFETVVGQLRATMTGERVLDPVAATERLARTYDLNEGEQASVLRHLATGGDLSQWGVVNAVTSAAKEAEGFDRQAELEVLGGALVALPEREWATIAR